MRRIAIITIFVVLFTVVASAQNVMIVHFSDGTTMELPMAMVDSFNYTQNEYFSAPTVETLPAIDVISNGASIELSINENGSGLTYFGFRWGTSPTLSTSDIVVTGGMLLSLDTLTANTTYYVRGFAENEIGFSYGNEISFTTAPVTLPVISGGITSSSVKDSVVSGTVNITDDGGGIITSYGLCWSLSPNPTTADFFVDAGIGMLGNNSYTTPILPPLTTFYCKPYATNSAGTTYGLERGFTTFGQGATYYSTGSGVSDIDGNTYNTVLIGNQEWTSENLRTTRFANGDTIPYEPLGAWLASEVAYAWYDNDTTNEIPHGKLYSVTAQEDNRNVCPTGWHVSTGTDWNVLVKFLDAAADTNGTSYQSYTAGGMLRALYSWTGNVSAGADESGISATASGVRSHYYNSYYFGQGTKTEFYGAGSGKSRAFTNYTGYLEIGSANSSWGFPVRCVRD